MSQPPATTPQKYTFDTEFFELVAEGRNAQGQRPKAETPEELQQRAFDEGFAAGLKEGQNQAQADLAQLQQHLQNTLLALQKTLDDREKNLTVQALSLTRITLHHLVGQALASQPDALLEHHLRSTLSLIKTDEVLTLRIHPGARGYHEKLQLPHAAIMGLPMHIQPDPALGPTDAVVEWKNGGVESKLTQHLKLLEETFSHVSIPILTAPPLPEAGSQPRPGTPAQPVPQAEVPQASTAPVLEVDEAALAAKRRAAELLGDDDLVDALKPK